MVGRDGKQDEVYVCLSGRKSMNVTRILFIALAQRMSLKSAIR